MVIAFLLIAVLAYNSNGTEANISPDLNISALPDSKQVEILIYMKEQSDTARVALEIEKQLPGSADQQKLKKETRKAILNNLQQSARRSRASILRFLKSNEKEDKASNIEGYYIVNMIYAQVSPELIEIIARRNDVV